MPEKVYRISIQRTVGLAAAILLLALIAVPARREPGVLTFILGVVLLAMTWVFWATGLEYRMTTSYISRRSRFGTRTLHWENLSELRYRGERRSYSLIPLGTYVTLRLRGALGEALIISGGGNVFGYLLACPMGVKELQDDVLKRSQEPLLHRLKSHFDAGDDLQLGPITLSRAAGIRLKTFRGTQQIPLDDLAQVGVQDGLVYLYRRNAAKSERGIPVAAVPNCLAFLSLLESLGVPFIAMQAGFWRPRETR